MYLKVLQKYPRKIQQIPEMKNLHGIFFYGSI